jgi:hypothetical protein
VLVLVKVLAAVANQMRSPVKFAETVNDVPEVGWS